MRPWCQVGSTRRCQRRRPGSSPGGRSRGALDGREGGLHPPARGSIPRGSTLTRRSRSAPCRFSICAARTVEPRGIEPRSGGCKPPSWPPRAPSKSDRRDSNPVRSAGNAVCFRPDTTVASRSAPSGVRTRVTGVRDRHPGRLDDRGVKHGRKESNPLRRCWRPHGRHVLVRKSSSGGIRTTHPSVQSRRSCRLDDRGMELRRLGSNQHRPGNSRLSCRLNDVASLSPPAWIRTTTAPVLSRMPLPVGLRGGDVLDGRPCATRRGRRAASPPGRPSDGRPVQAPKEGARGGTPPRQSPRSGSNRQPSAYKAAALPS